MTVAYRAGRAGAGAFILWAMVAACSGADPGTSPEEEGSTPGDPSDAGPGGPADPQKDPPAPTECSSGDECPSGVCTPSGECAAASATDGVKNQDETDVDCGGSNAPPCDSHLGCLVAADCVSQVCAPSGAGGESTCQPPSPTDGVKNGTETDVDCGGAGNPKCGFGKDCLVHSDCDKDACDYANKCEHAPSCVNRFGGDTCGTGEVGAPGAVHESCCATLPVTVDGAVVQLDKYQVTAGRMRAFLDAVNGNVRGFVQAARAAGRIPSVGGRSVLPAGWDLYLPTSKLGNAADDPAELNDKSQSGDTIVDVYTSAYRHVGGFAFANNNQTITGCNVAGNGTHAYWFDAATQASFGDTPHQHGRDVYDTKSIQCVTQIVAQAFCVWDGGRLETLDEWAAAWGPAAYPWGATPAPKGQGSATYWGCRFPTTNDAALRGGGTGCVAGLIPNTSQSIELANHNHSYEFPNLAGTDYVSFIAAPGRALGRGPAGHADVLGNNFEYTSTFVAYDATNPKATTVRWSGNGSWEGHGFTARGSAFTTQALNKYGKLGLRCAKL